MAELFGKTVPTINEHVKNVFKEGELEESAVIRNFRRASSRRCHADRDRVSVSEFGQKLRRCHDGDGAIVFKGQQVRVA